MNNKFGIFGKFYPLYVRNLFFVRIKNPTYFTISAAYIIHINIKLILLLSWPILGTSYIVL